MCLCVGVRVYVRVTPPGTGLSVPFPGFVVPQLISGFNLVYFSNVVIYAWRSRGLEMEGKWRHVACLWDFFVRGTVGGGFKKAESETGGAEERNERGEKKKKCPFANHLTIFFRAAEMLH